MYGQRLNRKKSKSRLVRRSISCFTSNVTLVLILILYVIAGGFLFVYTEAEAELRRINDRKVAVENYKQKFIDESKKQTEDFKKNLLNLAKQAFTEADKVVSIIDKSMNNNQFGRAMVFNKPETLTKLAGYRKISAKYKSMPVNNFAENITRESNKSISFFIDNFIKNVQNITNQGVVSNNNSTVLWTYAGAILYSVTVITTIGYGNIVPTTNEGKVATIIYAMLGIPLMVLCLTNLGSIFGNVFKVFYIFLRKHIKCRRKPLKKSASVLSLTETQAQSNRPTTVPNNKLIGKNLLLLSSESTNLTRITESSSEKQKKLHFTISIDTGDFMSNLHRKGDELELPLILPLSVFIVYILVGALLISYWEEWMYLNSCYFVFITFSTIGFGDLVPGLLNSQWKNEKKPIICAVYLFFGLVLLSMCFQLIQDMLRRRAMKLGKHIGLVKSPSPA